MRNDSADGDARAAITREAARKAIHLTSAAVPLALALGVARNVVVVGLAVSFAIALVVEIARQASITTASRFMCLFAPLLRAHEAHRATGATWLLGAMLLARLSLAESLTLGVIAAVAERASWPADDNARIVTLVGASAWLWSVVLY